MPTEADFRLTEQVHEFVRLDNSLPTVVGCLREPDRVLASLDSYVHSSTLLREIRDAVASGLHQIVNPMAKTELLQIRQNRTRTDQFGEFLELLAYAASPAGDEDWEEDQEERAATEKFRAAFSKFMAHDGLMARLTEPESAKELGLPVYSRPDVPLQDPDIFDFALDIEEDCLRYPEYLETAKEILHREVDPLMYRLRKLEIGGIIVSQNVPEHLIGHLRRLQQSYLHGLDEIAVVFCRSLLETAFFEQLTRTGKLKKATGQIVDIEESRKSWHYEELVNAASRDGWLDADQRLKALAIGRSAGEVLHGKQSVMQISREDACKTITDAFSIVESLFA